ncbi:biotin attachment protein [Oceanobacillus arenosus]|uniref:Biotin attachment protein n=1 Tax=Oceanobacillus arenosus TaxID=1229153 RepID=A0A3D8PZ09_9BACI|nr:biotin/lipoyl-containing protein [Oceanobacillus arenosus]RDW21396.1 biotin attachment protein [Oceanobacillus arenosus]
MKLVEVKLPQQGASMTDGDIVEWLVEVGDAVEKGQEIVEVDAAKASFTVTAPASGTVKTLEKEEDETVDVGDVIATIETRE